MSAVYLVTLAACIAASATFFFTGLGFAFAAAGRGAVAPRASAFALIAAFAIFIITLENGGVVRRGAYLDVAEITLTLAAGPALYLLIAALLGIRAKVLRASAPVLVAAAALLCFELIAGGDALRGAVIVQIGYTLAAGWQALTRGSARCESRVPLGAAVAAILLIAMALIHLMQLVRMAAPDAGGLSLAVPLMFAVVAFSGLVYAAAKIVRARDFRAAPVTATPGDIERLREALVADGLYLNPDYRLANLAETAGRTPAEVSSAINSATGTGFVGFLNRERLKKARMLLLSETEITTSVEAIGMMVGFKSRSAFYRAFANEFGLPPAAFRRSRLVLKDVSEQESQ